MERNTVKGFLAFTIWGLFPIYFAWLKDVHPILILISRIFFSFIFSFLIILLFQKKEDFFKIFKNKKNMIYIFLAGNVIAFNWFIFIYAILVNNVLETSLGYYISPLLSILIGVVFLKEKVFFWEKISLGLLVLAVFFKVYAFGHIPSISLSLGFSFAIYGLIKKKIKWDTLASFGMEMFLLIPLAVMILMLFIPSFDYQIFLNGQEKLLYWFLLIGVGFISVVPLLLFASSIKNLNLSFIGFLNFITPSISFLLGIFYFKENFVIQDLIIFILIWLGLLMINLGKIKKRLY